jgi:hypothetical protein
MFWLHLYYLLVLAVHGFPYCLVQESSGLPILTNFREARFSDKEHSDNIMPNIYRASEVILRSNWVYKVDIWNVAMVVELTLLDFGLIRIC